MAQSVIQSSTIGKYSGGATTVSKTLTGVAQGSDIVVTLVYSNFGAGGTVVTVSDGSAYTAEASEPNSSVSRAMILRRRNVTAGNYTVVATAPGTAGNSFGQVMVHEAAGNADLAVDQTVLTTASSATPATGASGTLANANEICFVVLTGDGTHSLSGMTHPPTSGWTSLYSDTSNSENDCSFAYKVVAATTAVSASWGTASVSGIWASALATFQAASTSGGRLVGGSLVGGNLIGVLA